MSRKEEMQILNEVYKNADMAASSLKTIMPKLYDEEFAAEIGAQMEEFKNFSAKAEKSIRGRGGKPKGTSKVVNAMTWMGIQRKTALDVSTSHMADMVIQGNTKGITEMMKKVHQNKAAGHFANELAKELMDMEEKNIDKIKKYL